MPEPAFPCGTTPAACLMGTSSGAAASGLPVGDMGLISFGAARSDRA